MKTEREQFYINEAKYAAQKAADARKAGDKESAFGHARAARWLMDRANELRQSRTTGKKKESNLSRMMP